MVMNMIEIRPLTTALGAEVLGPDLSQPLSNMEFDTIHNALLKHKVIFFRDQELTPEQHIAFARKFGLLDVHPYLPGLPGHEEVMPIVKEADDARKVNIGGRWHSDTTFYEEPAMGSILYALDVPEVGGDTMWANAGLAYARLSAGLKATLESLNALHSTQNSFAAGGRLEVKGDDAGMATMKLSTDDHEVKEVIHPVVRTHPETGEKILFVNPNFTIRFEGWSSEESQPLLAFLYEHTVRPEFLCRFRWQKGSIAFWDNRCTQHMALNDYHGSRREMHRVTVRGDKPV